MQIVNRSQLLPPACSFLSRTDKDEWYIDTGYFEDYYGTLYIGKKDFEEMCKLAGYESKENFAKFRNKIKEQHDELVDLRARVAEFESFRAAVLSHEAALASTGSEG